MSMKQKKQKQPLSKTFKKIATNKVLYIMLVPCMIYTFIFSYYPLTGWIMAFENYKPATGDPNLSDLISFDFYSKI